MILISGKKKGYWSGVSILGYLSLLPVRGMGHCYGVVILFKRPVSGYGSLLLSPGTDY